MFLHRRLNYSLRHQTTRPCTSAPHD
eukprot:UN14388